RHPILHLMTVQLPYRHAHNTCDYSFPHYKTLHTPPLSHFFLSQLPPPPTSTLFPYTTLFRSHPSAHPAHPTPGAGAPAPPKRCRDRKSTCLNSSHVSISYAVFCLKKKNKKT